MGVLEVDRSVYELPPRRAPLWRRVLREPLLHFLVAGLLLFAAAQTWRSLTDTRRIVVTPQRVAELAQKHRLQFGEAPNPGQLQALVDSYALEEALYREGKAQGLDRDDEIVRRRIAQKVQFLQQDRTLPREPGEAELAAWFQAHRADYARPVRTSFSHLFFASDAPGEARARAQAALAALRAGRASDAVGADPFPDLSEYTGLSRVEAERIFGQGGLAQAVDAAPAGQWSGPYPSAYGWHLVRVGARKRPERRRSTPSRTRSTRITCWRRGTPPTGRRCSAFAAGTRSSGWTRAPRNDGPRPTGGALRAPAGRGVAGGGA